MSGFFEGIENEQAFTGRAPILGPGNFLVEITNMGMRRSLKKSVDYLEVVFTILESDTPAFPKGTEACIMIWPAPYNYHKKRAKSLIEAAFPGKPITEALCNQLIEEDLLAGTQLRVRSMSNPKAPKFCDYTYAAA